jgi:hypothetical protein
MSYSSFHETSNICPGIVRQGARETRDGAARRRRFRPSPVLDPSGERPREVSSEDRPRPRVRFANGEERHPSLQRAWPRDPHAESAEALREMLHRSPREFGRESSLWTLEMAADVAFEEGLTPERVSGETIRATLSRLLSVRWMRAKRWITSPDPLYERKKEGATD